MRSHTLPRRFREESHPRRARHRDRCLELERHDGLVQVERHLQRRCIAPIAALLFRQTEAPDELPEALFGAPPWIEHRGLAVAMVAEGIAILDAAGLPHGTFDVSGLTRADDEADATRRLMKKRHERRRRRAVQQAHPLINENISCPRAAPGGRLDLRDGFPQRGNVHGKFEAVVAVVVATVLRHRRSVERLHFSDGPTDAGDEAVRRVILALHEESLGLHD
mmetsp:Transcript_13406/g.39207  ORF Transcript_13406/g.39207 Transcript_13406/m.39207 type:complete len:222 (+) Transcript_13406:110-775(+)